MLTIHSYIYEGCAAVYVRCDSCGISFYEPLLRARRGALGCVGCGVDISLPCLSGANGERDLWTIVTEGGQSLQFTSRADVDTAILAGKVRAGDCLIGGHAPSTPIEHVVEFRESFENGIDIEQTLPYGAHLVPSPPPELARETWRPRKRADSLEDAILELAGAPVPDSRPSVFDFGVLDEPVMTPRRPSEPAPTVESSVPPRAPAASSSYAGDSVSASSNSYDD